MEIKQDPITGLWARSDGAVLMPPNGFRWKKFRWTFGIKMHDGYRTVNYRGKLHYVHQIICRAFHGPCPPDKPEVDHISRVRSANFASNLRWADRKGNAANQDCVDRSIERYGVRRCDDKQGYNKSYRAAHCEEIKAREKSYYAAHREERKAGAAAYAAKMKGQGLVYRKGPDGKYHWCPKNNTITPNKEA